MNSDFLLINQELRQQNDSALEKLTYTPAFLMNNIKRQTYPLVNKNFNIMNPFSNIDDIKTTKIGSYETQINHVKSTANPFAYYSKVYGVQYNESNFQQNAMTARATTDATVLRALNIETDKELWNGDNDKQYSNTGIKNNPNTITTSQTPTTLEDLYNSIITTVQQEIYDINKTAGNGVTLILSTAIQVAFSKAYGAQMTYWQRLMNVLETSNIADIRIVQNFITGGEVFYAVVLNDVCTYHLGLLPQIYQTGVNIEMNYQYTQYLRQSIGLQVEQKGGVLYNTITALPETFTLTSDDFKKANKVLA